MIINKVFIFALFLSCALPMPGRAEMAVEKSYFAAGKSDMEAGGAKQYDPALGKELVYRVAFGGADEVRILLDKGADPQSKNIADVPVLLIAIIRKDAAAPIIVKNLIKAGANVNAVSKNGNVAALEAVKNGRPDILQILIDNHAVLGAVHDAEGNDLLTVAESRGNLDIVKILNAGLENEKDKIQSLKSQDNFIHIIQQYAFLSCASEYLNFYIASQPKNINMVAFNNVITANSREISETGGQLKMLFKMKDDELQSIQSSARSQIISQLQYYETNENRELNGIGTDGDLNERCWKIARKWNASKMNLEQYRQNTK